MLTTPRVPKMPTPHRHRVACRRGTMSSLPLRIERELGDGPLISAASTDIDARQPTSDKRPAHAVSSPHRLRKQMLDAFSP